MRLGIMQPYFFPYIGYWQLINAVDTYVIYDDVTYIKGGWINRNNFLINGEKRLHTVTLRNSSSFKLIKDIELMDDFGKFLKMLQLNYNKAPYYKETIDIVDRIVSYNKSNLAAFLGNGISIIMKHLGINTEVIYSSALNKDKELKGADRVLDICKLLDASTYINAIGGKELYSQEKFEANGVNLRFLKTNFKPYMQLKNNYIPGLSIIDVMMFNSVSEIKEMLNDYELI